MIYLLKSVELLVIFVYALALFGAWLKKKDEWGSSRWNALELLMIGFISTSVCVHIINLFR